MEKMKEVDEAIMSLRFKIGRNELVTDDDLYQLQIRNFKSWEHTEHFQTADEIVRKIADYKNLSSTEIANAIQQARTYAKKMEGLKTAHRV